MSHSTANLSTLAQSPVHHPSSKLILRLDDSPNIESNCSSSPYSLKTRSSSPFREEQIAHHKIIDYNKGEIRLSKK